MHATMGLDQYIHAYKSKDAVEVKARLLRLDYLDKLRSLLYSLRVALTSHGMEDEKVNRWYEEISEYVKSYNIPEIFTLRKAYVIQRMFAKVIWNGEYKNCVTTQVPAEEMHRIYQTMRRIGIHFQKHLEGILRVTLEKDLWEYEDFYKLLREEYKFTCFEIGKALEQAAERSVKYAEKQTNDADDWDDGGWPFFQMLLFLQGMHKFWESVEEGETVAFAYSCWY